MPSGGSSDFQADGFGIGWYDPQDTPAPLLPGTTAPQTLLPQTNTAGAPPTSSPGDLRQNGNSHNVALADGQDAYHGDQEELAAALEVVKKREAELELENQRPCVFKSISPVSPNPGRGIVTKLIKARLGVTPISSD